MTTNAAKPRVKTVVPKNVGGSSSSRASLTHAPSLADAGMKSTVRAFKREVTKSPEAADHFLRSIGMLTPTGRLSKTYGG